MTKYRTFGECLRERLKDSEQASIYLSIAVEEYEKDGDTRAFLLALRDVTQAQGGMAKLAKKTKLNRESLYRTLSGNGNPRISTLENILSNLGFCLSIQVKEKV